MIQSISFFVKNYRNKNSARYACRICYKYFMSDRANCLCTVVILKGEAVVSASWSVKNGLGVKIFRPFCDSILNLYEKRDIRNIFF